MSIELTTFGENHPSVALTYNNIASVLILKNELNKAMTLLEKSIQINTEAYEGGHPVIATSYDFLGAIFIKLNQYKKALDYYTTSFEIRSNILGKDHEDTKLAGEMIELCKSKGIS